MQRFIVMWVTSLFLLGIFLELVTSEVLYDVSCSDKIMKVTVTVSSHSNKSAVFIDKLKGFPRCQPEKKKESSGKTKTIIKLPLGDKFHECGTTRMTNKYTGQTIYYNRIRIEERDRRSEVLLVKCVLPGEKSKSSRTRPKRNLPDGFFEYEELNITNIVAHAPTPFLNLAIRQNGRLLDTTYNVEPGTPLEMLIYLDEKSAPTYGLLSSYMKVTDDTPDHDEVIVMNGCSIDPYIFGNFQTPDNGKTLYSKFRAFKFPDSNYVLFVGTVNVCLKECRGVPCGNGQLGFGRKKREIPAEMPFDPNKLYEVEMTTAIKVQFGPDHFKPKKSSIKGNFDGLQMNELAAYTQENSACSLYLLQPVKILTVLVLMCMLHH